MALSDADAHAEVRVGLRYVADNEAAFAAWCAATGRDPEDDWHDAEWCDLSDEEANEFIFPRVPDHLL